MTLVLAFLFSVGNNIFATSLTATTSIDGYGSSETGSLRNYEGYKITLSCTRGSTKAAAYYYSGGSYGSLVVGSKVTNKASDIAVSYKEFNPDYGVRVYAKVENDSIFGSKATVTLKAYNSN